MKADKYRFDGTEKCSLKKLPTDSRNSGLDKQGAEEKLQENLKKLAELQNRFYADGREGLIIALQAMDAAGKDSLIRHVASGMNPQGVKVSCFKRPTSEELAHDYLWRVNKVLPKRGEIAIFNRSHYEDVLAASVLNLKDTYGMAERVTGVSKDKFISRRMKQIRAYEEYLYENSYRVIKVFLNVSKDEQKKRFLERIERPDKNWKFEPADLDTREKFDEYMEVYEDVINETSTKESPWYVLPADDKWFTRYLFSEVLIDAIERCKPAYPQVDPEVAARLNEYKEQLENEKN